MASSARDRPFEHAPPLIEDTYTVTDALVVGCTLITLLRHADRVRMACLAQLVNVIAPIRTLDGGPAWRQTTFFPFRDAARHGRGTVLRVEPEGPTYPTEGDEAVPVLEATAVHDEDSADVVRRQPRHRAAGARGGPALRARACSSTPCWPTTTRRRRTPPKQPERVGPRVLTGARIDGERLRATLPPRSWNVLRLRTQPFTRRRSRVGVWPTSPNDPPLPPCARSASWPSPP